MKKKILFVLFLFIVSYIFIIKFSYLKFDDVIKLKSINYIQIEDARGKNTLMVNESKKILIMNAFESYKYRKIKLKTNKYYFTVTNEKPEFWMDISGVDYENTEQQLRLLIRPSNSIYILDFGRNSFVDIKVKEWIKSSDLYDDLLDILPKEIIRGKTDEAHTGEGAYSPNTTGEV